MSKKNYGKEQRQGEKQDSEELFGLSLSVVRSFNTI